MSNDFHSAINIRESYKWGICMKKRIRLFLTILVIAALVFQSLIFMQFNSVLADAKKEIVVYFPNWATYISTNNNFAVGDIPWDKVTAINHAFFKIADDFTIQTTDEYADFQKVFEHSGNNQLKGHFGEYKYYKAVYPDVKLIISIGGWTESKKFHEMALTAANRKVFIDSILELFKTYPFVDGVDLDWEYPGVSRADCPGGPEDKQNFTTLLKEIRQAYEDNKLYDKLLTIAASAGASTIMKAEPDKYAEYLDFINIMAYDMHGAWDTITNHHSPLYAKDGLSVDDAVRVFTDKYGVPASKLVIGTPYYSKGWKDVPDTENHGLGVSGSSNLEGTVGPGGQNTYFRMKELEAMTGVFTKYWDDAAKATYLYSPTLHEMYTYEDKRSIGERCKYVIDNNCGGIMVWTIAYDDKADDFPLTSLIAERFGIGSVVTPTPAKVLLGDLNGDGNVNSIDFGYFRMYLLGTIKDFPIENDLKAADLNGDGNINSIDYGYFRMYLLGTIKEFPASQFGK